MLPDFLNFIIWGHEHECRIRPEEATLSLCPAPCTELVCFALTTTRLASILALRIAWSLPRHTRSNCIVPLMTMASICVDDIAEDGKVAHLTQPGSTVQTSLIAVEAERKHMVRTEKTA